jgi:ABC-2 type transport system ATP-binding protein
MIKLNQIAKKINNKTVLDKVAFEVKDGEILGLVGPNGAGKTTLLNIIAGVWQQDQGVVEINGVDNAKENMALRKKIGYVPDSPYLYAKLTGREFLSFVADLYQLDHASFKKKLDEIEKVFDLTPWLDNLMESYPRGVRQKMVIGSMLLHSPSIFLLDEPLTNLDPKSSKLVKELLQKMAGNGAAILFSTQILDIAEKICHRVVVLDNGKKIAEGSVAQLRSLAKIASNNLEDIFLQLTGGEKYAELLANLA